MPKAPGSALLIILIFAGSHLHAQERIDAQASVNEELWKAEAEIQLLQCGTLDSLNVAMRAWGRLKAILPAIAEDAGLRMRVERDMSPLEEFLGERDLQIANLYLDRERGSTRGAQIRLLHITREYPDFSKIDEVLFRLSDVSLREDDRDQASTYLYRLVCRYPGSLHAKAAFERLNEIGFYAIEGCDKYKKKELPESR